MKQDIEKVIDFLFKVLEKIELHWNLCIGTYLIIAGFILSSTQAMAEQYFYGIVISIGLLAFIYINKRSLFKAYTLMIAVLEELKSRSQELPSYWLKGKELVINLDYKSQRKIAMRAHLLADSLILVLIWYAIFNS